MLGQKHVADDIGSGRQSDSDNRVFARPIILNPDLECLFLAYGPDARAQEIGHHGTRVDSLPAQYRCFGK
jgi:hypothetical protein